MKFRLSSDYGVLEHVRSGAHTGIDLAMPEGTKLRSIADGVVEKIYDGSGAIGNGVKIKSDDGQEIIYGHMKDVDVHLGERVDYGEYIGLSGNSGNSTGPHLHFGMKEDGHFIDPTKYAEELDGLSGDIVAMSAPVLGPLGELIWNPVKDHIKETTKETIVGIAEGCLEIFIDTIGAVTLVGSALLIILRVAGYDKGYRWAGILFAINTLVKYLIGG